jgi:hypothetical protein
MVKEMRNAKCTRNDHIRKVITETLSKLPSGAIIDTSHTREIFKNYYRGTTNRNISCLMRERDDVVLDAPGTWRVKGESL